MTPLPRCLLAAGLFATSPALYATSGSFACKVAGCTYPSRRKDDEMKIAEVRVSGCRCETVRLEPIPRGIVGAVVAVEYTDPAWDSLRKTVVFRGAATKDVLDAGNEIVIPAEVVSKAGGSLYMGVYGVNAENHVAIPTIWTELGVIQGAATPSGDASTAPSLPVWAQIQAMVGDLGTLDTEAKSNLVAAINEALTKGGEIAPAEVQRMLKTEWTMAMPYIVACSSSIAGANAARTMQNMLSSIMTPMTLNIRCTTAARWAFLFVPTEEIIAVTHVPMFCPMMMGIAAA